MDLARRFSFLIVRIWFSRLSQIRFPKRFLSPVPCTFCFLAEPPSEIDEKALDEAKAPTEKYLLTDKVFYLYAPDGIARSKLAANAEKLLGVVATGRNYRTVDKLRSIAFAS